MFRILDEEAKLQDFRQPVFFASHPKLQERIDSFAELAGGSPPGGEIRAAAYVARTAPVRPAWLEAELSLAQPKSLILQLTKDGAPARFGPHLGYYLGEAYCLRSEAEDDARGALADYLTRAPAARDRTYIDAYLAEIDRGPAAPPKEQ